MTDHLAPPQDFNDPPVYPVNYGAASSGPPPSSYYPTDSTDGVAELSPGDVAVPVSLGRRGGTPRKVTVPTQLHLKEYTIPDQPAIPKTSAQREQNRKNEETMRRHPLSYDNNPSDTVARIANGMRAGLPPVPTYTVDPKHWEKTQPDWKIILASVAGFASVCLIIFLATRYMNKPSEVIVQAADVVKKTAKKGVLRPERLVRISESIAK
jgi:hypothetical protein